VQEEIATPFLEVSPADECCKLHSRPSTVKHTTVSNVTRLVGTSGLSILVVLTLPFLLSVLVAASGLQSNDEKWWLALILSVCSHLVAGCFVGFLARRVAGSLWPIGLSSSALVFFFLFGLLGGLGDGSFDATTQAAATGLASWIAALLGMLIVYARE